MKKHEPTKTARKPAAKSADALKTAKKSKGELTDEQTERVSGGAIDAFMQFTDK